MPTFLPASTKNLSALKSFRVVLRHSIGGASEKTIEMQNENKKTKLERLEAVIDRRQHDMFRFAYMRTGSRADAEDIVQDVFLRLFRS